MSKVAIIKCDSYEYEKVLKSVKRGLELLGGVTEFVKTGEKILLKPNLLSADESSRNATTHHNVFKAVIESFNTQDIKLSFGDSPGFHKPKTAANKTGMLNIAKELGVGLADFDNGKEISFDEAKQNKKFYIANAVLETDGLISLSKMKAHGLTRITGAVKNQFGCIPGKLKGEFHARIPNVKDFSKMLVDLNLYIKPRLYIMDGIIAMEGNGPRNGNAKQMNVLLFSKDPVALDATVCKLVDLNPEFVPTNVFGKAFGLGTYVDSEIELVGDDIKDLISKNFDVVREPVKDYKPGKVFNAFRNIFVLKPVIDSSKCVKCGVCVEVCPVEGKALNWKNRNKQNPPVYKYEKCIRCYCCQELCPEGAIDLRKPFLRKIFS